MHAFDDRLVLSATDLSNFLVCPHLSLLDRETARGGPKPPTFEDPALEVLQQRGHEHERALLEAMKAGGAERVVEVPSADPSRPLSERWETQHRATVEAMRGGADVIYQGGLFDGTWLGKPDFLVRVDAPSALGAWSYEVLDAKLAREAKGGALLQVLLYAELVAGMQERTPERVHLALGGPDARTESFRVAEYAATFRSVRGRLLEWLRGEKPPPVAPEPTDHCAICAWRGRCDGERHDADHLSLVAGAGRAPRRALVERGVSTVEALAGITLPIRPALEGVSDAALERLHHQARIQVEGRTADAPRYELLLPAVEKEGLAALPEPSPGDLFFDLEGDPYALTHGLEYLFGFADAEGRYEGWWALTRVEERRVFERFIDLVMARLEEHPDLHVYHFAPYEPTALKHLMGRHGTREDEVDHLLRRGVFVDLHRVVRQSLRASVESYSIKKLEPFYGFKRVVELRDASRALARFEAWLELGGDAGEGDALRRAILGYNEDDCRSTRGLHAWLEDRRHELASLTGSPVPRPPREDGERTEEQERRQEEVACRMDALLADVPEEEGERTPEQHARWLLAQLLEYYRREDKSTWWEYYRCLDLGQGEWIEDRAVLGGLEYEGEVGTIKRSVVHRYRFPKQDHGLKPSTDVQDIDARKAPGEVVAIDDAAGTIDLKRGKSSTVPHPRALVPFDFVGTTEQRLSLLRSADAVLEHGLADANSLRATVDLLLSRPPRVGTTPGTSLIRPGEATLDAARRLTLALDGGVLPVQGPPGSGKTYTGARMIVGALSAGKRVGITATSHKVISNLLEEVCRAGREEKVPVRGVQKANPDQRCADETIEAMDRPGDVAVALAEGEFQLAAGTAWLWSREDMQGSVDLLFVDEAGQFSLADALAVSPAATGIVMLGDPRQLERPQQGVHPPGTDVSALDHLLRGEATIPVDRGLFLEHTWRLHPDLSRFTSEVFYAGRLGSREGLERQVVHGPAPLTGSGLRFFAAPHEGNRSESAEEVEAVAGLVERLVAEGAWTDLEGRRRSLVLKDVLVVAPYNAQVDAIRARLAAGARVGTVDKFQGQEAPVVIYSMATSSAEEAPRGMQFLYSPNRLNVATSRARCLAIVVASPALFAPPCRTPEHMRLANPFCRFAELAGPQLHL